jgi:glucan phosphoethanolaminetransferase (alkaline phosphatase superfamily)
MNSGVLIFAAVTYLLMLIAFKYSHIRAFHVPVMATIIIMDMFVPFYLVFTRDWYKRLITEEEIFSFMIWSHVIVVLALYSLYILQIQAGRKLLKDPNASHQEHRAQGIGILLVRGLVIISASMVIEPASTGVT